MTARRLRVSRMRTFRLTPGIGAASVLLLASVLRGAEPHSVEMPNVGVVVRNFSAAPLGLVQKAEASCQQIYRAAGIRLTWINSVEDVTWEGPDVVFRAVILPQAPPSRALAAFGTALRERQELLLYHDRIVRFAKIVDLPMQSMLSVALVHEIGHLLLDSDDHTSSGIMRAEWDREDLNGILRGQSHFTSSQVRRMKANIERSGSTRVR